MIARLEPIIMEMERHREPLLIVGHQGEKYLFIRAFFVFAVLNSCFKLFLDLFPQFYDFMTYLIGKICLAIHCLTDLYFKSRSNLIVIQLLLVFCVGILRVIFAFYIIT